MSRNSSQIVIDLILRRRSIRDGFTKKKVPPETIDQILECGINAPSSKNSQPWRFHVVTDMELLSEIAAQISRAKGIEDFRPIDPETGEPRAEYRSSVVESAQILESAPLAIFVENSGPYTNNRADVLNTATDVLIGFSVEYLSLGMAIENMWLAAQANGIYGVFMADILVVEEFIKANLKMTGDLVGVLSLGYSENDPCPKTVNRNNVIRHK